MKGRLWRRKARGQSAILIALMIVVLIGMVGLAVDVGNTYAEQRKTVRAANAAALAGMDKLLANGTDQDIARAIQGSFASNGLKVQVDPTVPLQPGERRVRGLYLDVNGDRLGDCFIGDCASANGQGLPPQGTTYIQLNVDGQVDTYFARVVGTKALPVNARAFAARCAPTKNVYPIGIWASAVPDENGFVPPDDPNQMQYYGIYKDADYPRGKTQRRIYIKNQEAGAPVPGSFSFLTWKPEASYTNANGLQAMLERDGNLNKGFVEGRWDPQQNRSVWPYDKEPAPASYPYNRGMLDPGDWVYGNSGLSWSNDIKAALQYHVDNRTKMNLPIISKWTKVGGDEFFYIQRIGTFYLRGYSQQGGNNAWFDLVYLGDASQQACLTTNLEEITKVPPGVTPPAINTNSIGLNGTIGLLPQWGQRTVGNDPIAFTFILDVSGSMSWNFLGEGTVGGTINYQADSTGGTDYECENPGNKSSLPYRSTCSGGPGDPWRKVAERRIAVSKTAIKRFIDTMDTGDTMRIVAFSSDMSGGPARYTSVAPSSWVTDKAQMKAAVDNIGKYNNDMYRTSGGTPGANGVKGALSLLQSSSMPKKAPDGRTYKRVVIYLTDGVANIFLDGNVNDARDICGNMSPNQARNTPYCQIGVMSNGVERPITAMISQAQKIRNLDDSTAIYALAVGPVPPDGLALVANGDNYFFQAADPGAVDAIFAQIRAQIEGPCVEQMGNTVYKVDGDNTPDPAYLPEALPSDAYGYVTIEDSAGNPLPDGKGKAPIRHSPYTGRLTYSIPADAGLKPGEYRIKAWVAYKGQDGVTRVYNAFFAVDNEKNLLPAKTNTYNYRVTPSEMLGSVQTVPTLFLGLPSNTKVCKN